MGKKRKFGASDVVVILAIIAVVVVAVKFFATDKNETASTSGEAIAFTVELGKVPDNFLEGVEEGDKVYDAKAGGYLGTVAKTELVPHKELVYDPTTNISKEVVVEELQDAHITINANAEISDRKTSVEGTDVMVGTELSLKSRSFAGTGYCIILEEK